MALPTKGRVVLETTAGELDIELWSKEAPKTCRNFIALALEGYYDGVIFHRIVPNFLIQTGDKTGTGGGGESFYGEPFEDEIHPRLKFPHRGIVAMANRGKKNTNDSQFFITLDMAPELHGKHTVFGRCVGDTIYNAAKIGESEIDKNERPVYPPKIRSIRIIDNPFDDIVPRITAAERKAQQKAREQAKREREEEISRRGAKKNTKLLSFGADEGAEEEEKEEEPVTFKKKPMYRPDLMEQQRVTEVPDFVTQLPTKPKAATETAQASTTADDETKKSKKKKDKSADDDDITKIRERHAVEQANSKSARAKEISALESDIKKLTKRRGGDSDDESDEDEERKKKKVKTNYVEDEIAKYRNRAKISKKKGKRKDESAVLAAMTSFRGKLQGARLSPTPPPTEEGEDQQPLDGEAEDGAVQDQAPGPEEPPMDVDDDLDFFGHRLTFARDNKIAEDEERGKAERDYEVIDPRARGERAKEEERERKRREKERRDGKSGGGRRRY